MNVSLTGMAKTIIFFRLVNWNTEFYCTLQNTCTSIRIKILQPAPKRVEGYNLFNFQMMLWGFWNRKLCGTYNSVMDILKIPLRNGSMVRYPSSSGLILLATLRIGIHRGHRVSRLLWECRLLYRYLFPFLVKHCHLAQNSKKRTHSLTCVFFVSYIQGSKEAAAHHKTPRHHVVSSERSLSNAAMVWVFRS